jgi:hypothetical protein
MHWQEKRNSPNSGIENHLNTWASPPSPKSFKSSCRSENCAAEPFGDTLEKQRMELEALAKQHKAWTYQQGKEEKNILLLQEFT